MWRWLGCQHADKRTSHDEDEGHVRLPGRRCQLRGRLRRLQSGGADDPASPGEDQQADRRADRGRDPPTLTKADLARDRQKIRRAVAQVEALRSTYLACPGHDPNLDANVKALKTYVH